MFADLGLPDADEHLVKAGLVVRIGRIIRERGLTQSAAAKLRGYSVERLMRFLVALGQDVEIVVKPVQRGVARPRVA